LTKVKTVFANGEVNLAIINRLTCVLFVAAILLAASFLAPRAQPSAGTSTPGSSPPSGISLPADVNKAPVDTSPAQQQVGRPTTYTTTKTPYEFYLCGLTIFLGVSALILVSILFRRHIGDKTEEFVKVFAFVIVAFSALFLIVAGYADSQVAPAYSLLGTIIGYVFGRNGSRQPGGGAAQEPAAAADGGPAPRAAAVA
jgi:hypothetical protein